MNYSHIWDNMYRYEAEEIRDILGSDLVALYHIGSTSVPGMKAKPVIDIMPVIKNISDIKKYEKIFKGLGYSKLEECSSPTVWFYTKGNDSEYTHQLRIVDLSNEDEINARLALRNYLRCHPDVAGTYSEFKQQLAVKFSHDMSTYRTEKNIFLKPIEKDALIWCQQN